MRLLIYNCGRLCYCFSCCTWWWLEEYGEATSSRFACTSTLQKCEERTLRREGRSGRDLTREWRKNLSILPEFFFFHSSFFILHFSFFIFHSSFFIYYNASPPRLCVPSASRAPRKLFILCLNKYISIRIKQKQATLPNEHDPFCHNLIWHTK